MESLSANTLDPAPVTRRPRSVRRRQFPAGWIAIVIAATGLLSFAAFVATGEPNLLLLALALALSAVPFALAAGDAPERLLHPLTLFGFSMLLGVAGQTAFLAFLATPAEEYALLTGVGESGLTQGLLVVAVGTGALALGFLAATPPSRPRPGRMLRSMVGAGMAKPSVKRMTVIVGVLCAISMVSFALYAPKVGISGLSDLLTSQKRFVDVAGGTTSLGYYRFGISLAGVAFVLAVYTAAVWRIRLLSTLGAIGTLSLLITALSSITVSSRSELLIPVASAALLVVAVRGREPRPGRVLAVVAAGLVLITILAGLRAVGQGQTASLGDAVNPGSLAENPVASRDWMGIGPISAVVTRVPDRYEFQYGATMVSVLWAPIPKSIWPDKPPVRLGPEISPAVYEFSYKRRTGDPPGYLGELWLNGGFIGVVIGMAAFGALLRWIERWNRLSAESQGLGALIYAVLAVELALRLPKDDVTGALLAVIGSLPLMLLALWFGRTRSPRPRLS